MYVNLGDSGGSVLFEAIKRARENATNIADEIVFIADNDPRDVWVQPTDNPRPVVSGPIYDVQNMPRDFVGPVYVPPNAAPLPAPLPAPAPVPAPAPAPVFVPTSSPVAAPVPAPAPVSAAPAVIAPSPVAQGANVNAPFGVDPRSFAQAIAPVDGGFAGEVSFSRGESDSENAGVSPRTLLSIALLVAPFIVR